MGSLLGAGGANLWGLLEKLKAAGLEDKVMSWIGRGENKPISPDEVKAGVPADQIEAGAAKLGISRASAARKIAAAPPRGLSPRSGGKTPREGRGLAPSRGAPSPRPPALSNPRPQARSRDQWPR